MALPHLSYITSPDKIAERDTNFISVGQSYIIQNFILSKINNFENVYSRAFSLYCYNNEENIKEVLNSLFTEDGWQIIECTANQVVILNETTCFVYSYHQTQKDEETTSRTINYYITGTDKAAIETLKDRMSSIYSEKISNKAFIKWVFRTQMGTSHYNTSLEMDKEPFNEMYPFLDGEDLKAYYNRFAKSDSSILLLQGPPGTGKTSFVRGLLSHLNVNSIFTTDPDVFHNEGFLIDFMKGSENYLIFEDADAYLSSRETGNKTLHKLLTIGDGLISRKRKKIIFTTNLESITDIDSALIRPGRCHDILQFRALTPQECQDIIVSKGFEIEIPKTNTTIADIFNTQEKTEVKSKKTIGFAI